MQLTISDSGKKLAKNLDGYRQKEAEKSECYDKPRRTGTGGRSKNRALHHEITR